MNRIEFYYFHPLSLFLYFIFVLLLTMFTFNPVMLLISLFGAAAFDVFVNRFDFKIKSYVFYAIIFVITTLTNPLFSHNGMTTLFYLGDNAVTLESFFYGANVALMIISVMIWCRNYSVCVTQDKFLFLFSKLLPKTALIISCAIRFIPLFLYKYRQISDAQKGIGTDSEKKGMDKIKYRMTVFSALVTWSLEKSVETSDSMKSRGYDLKPKTSYSPFRFCIKDGLLIFLSVLLFATVATAVFSGKLDFYFYPLMTFTPFTPLCAVGYAAFAVISFTPFIIELKENLLWKYFVSKI